MARTRLQLVLLAFVATAAMPWPSFGHEIPNDVTVRMILKPAGERLQVLVRVPLEAMQDIEVPLHGAGYLDLARADTALRNAALLWLANDLSIYEDARRLPPPTLVGVRASLPSDRSFAHLETALAHLRGPPLPPSTQIVWQQVLLDALFEIPIESDTARFAVHPTFGRLGLRVQTAVQFVTSGGATREFQLGADPGVVTLDPRWHQSFLRFLRQGFEHILDGADHLLFLLCLVVPLRREPWALLSVVTGFTVGHSVTLLGSALGRAPEALWFPPLVETLIATSILYMAVENVVAETAAARELGPTVRRRTAIAASLGLIHGFGFSFALRDSLQFAGDHLITSLLAFNIGIELGQLLAVLLIVPALYLLFRFVIPQRIGTIVLAVIVGHVAWHWLDERLAALLQHDLSAPLF